jgi:hypothetical protein
MLKKRKKQGCNLNTKAFKNLKNIFVSNLLIIKSSNKIIKNYCFSNHANINGTTMVASDSTINLGVWISSFPQVIFSFGTAPEYEPYDVVESDIWQK